MDHTRSQLSRKDTREGENTRYPGGMRNPMAAIAQMPGWTRVGERIWDALVPIIDSNQDAYQVGVRPEDKDYLGPSQDTRRLIKVALISKFSLLSDQRLVLSGTSRAHGTGRASGPIGGCW